MDSDFRLIYLCLFSAIYSGLVYTVAKHWVVNDVVFVLLQLVHLVLQGSRDLDGAPGNLLVEARAEEENKVSQPLE